ncbi:MAG: penicillin-binding protein 2 [Alphaproteobacteria bacterium]|nr:penicillin-binding protein 2 [Alphaproteobacteria bacterium]
MKVWRKIRSGYDALQPMLPGLPVGDGVRRTVASPGRQALEQARGRLVFTGLMFLVVFAVIALRLVDVMAITSANDRDGRLIITQNSGGRADIVDRNGAVLATSLPTVSVCADAKHILDPEQATKQLLGVLPDLDEKELLSNLKSKKRCVMVRRHLTPKQHNAVNRLGIAGLEFLHDERRVYPESNLTAQLVGFTDIDNIGIAGLEKSMDLHLRQDQEPVELSVDIRAQHILHRELDAARRKFRAIGAAGMIMDVRTGELLALVSLPDFDPHRSGTASDSAKFNRDTSGVYELGSVFKIFTLAMALDNGEIKVSDRFDATHPLTIGRQTISDYHPENRWLSVPEIMIHSSNIGMARIADKVGGLRQRAFFDTLGMFEPARIEVPEIGRPLVPDRWGDVTTMTVAFGHGLAVSPLRMVTAAAAIVNDGKQVTPTLLRQKIARRASEDTVISPATSAMIRGMMRLVVTEGTARQADVPGYLVGGKTGTAEKVTANGYNRDAKLSSFLGVFPLNAPRYAVFVMLDEPKGTAETFGFATAGWVAAPTVGKVIGDVAPLLGIAPLDDAAMARGEAALLKPLGRRLSLLLQRDGSYDQYASAGTSGAN